MTVDAPDNRLFHVKLITINGVTHFVSILPPGPIQADETVWRERKRPSEMSFSYDGADSLMAYVQAREDRA